MEWKGHFSKASYQGQLVIQETVDGDYNFDLMFGSSSTMAGELDNFTRNLTDQAYSLLLSSSPCGEKWEKRQLGFLEANETIEDLKVHVRERQQQIDQMDQEAQKLR